MLKRAALGRGSSGSTGWLAGIWGIAAADSPGGVTALQRSSPAPRARSPPEQASSQGCSRRQGPCKRLLETAWDRWPPHPESDSFQLSVSAWPEAAEVQRRASPCTAHKAPRAVEKCKEKGHPQLKSTKKIFKGFFRSYI